MHENTHQKRAEPRERNANPSGHPLLMPMRKMSPGGSRGWTHGQFVVRANVVTSKCRTFLLFPHSSVPLFVSSARKRNSCLRAALPPNLAGPLGFVPSGARRVSFGLVNSGSIWLRAFLFWLHYIFAGAFRRAQDPVVDGKSSSGVDSGQKVRSWNRSKDGGPSRRAPT